MRTRTIYTTSGEHVTMHRDSVGSRDRWNIPASVKAPLGNARGYPVCLQALRVEGGWLLTLLRAGVCARNIVGDTHIIRSTIGEALEALTAREFFF